MKKIINIIFSILTGILFVFTLLLMFIGIKANTSGDRPKIFGYAYSAVPTDSMVSAIMPGDIVVTKMTPFSELEVDDIIVFYSSVDNIYKVHRIKEINENGIITQGDNVPIADTEITTIDTYDGKVVKVIPKFGTLILSYKNLFFALIIISFSYIIVIELIKIVKYINEARREKYEAEFREKYSLVEELKENNTLKEVSNKYHSLEKKKPTQKPNKDKKKNRKVEDLSDFKF